jgi:hypothetical protein
MCVSSASVMDPSLDSSSGSEPTPRVMSTAIRIWRV